jgi:hypothetical protein
MRRWEIVGLQVVAGVMLFWGVTHAALSNYQQKEQAIRESCSAQRAKLTPQQLKQTNCGTPQIALVSRPRIKPGETVDVAFNGTFPAGTAFVFQSDSVEVLKESCAANSYRATIRVSPGVAPKTVSVTALTPAPCCKGAYLSHALTITANYAWDMQGSNGWKVKALPLPSDPSAGQEMLYALEFYRGSETAPFAKRRATFYPAEGDSSSFSFSISGQDESSMNVQQQLEALTKQLQNPSLSDADRDKLMKKMQDLMTQMTATMQDPGYMKKLQAEAQEFGCSGIHLNLQNGALSGNMNCGQKAGGSIKMTGTMRQLP